MKVLLTVIEGPHAGKSFEFDRHDTFIVGRGKNAQFRLTQDDKFFSRNHFMVEVNPPLCRLLDLNSSNGTFVNGKREASIDLSDGDRIRGGETTIAVSFNWPTGQQPAEGQATDNRGTLVPWAGAAGGKGVSRRTDDPAFPPNHFVDNRATLVPQGRGPMPFASDSVAPATMQLRGGEQPLNSPATRPPGSVEGGGGHGGGTPGAASDALPYFNGYRTIRILGRGGMGIVYEAESLADQSHVAIKVISPTVAASEEDLSRFIREATILRDLVHPNIVRYRDLAQQNGRLFIVMDYVNGTTAGSLVSASSALMPISRGVGLIVQLLEALAYAHQRGYVHRDIKPANLLITSHNGVDRLSLADFGLARAYQSTSLSGLTMTGDVNGTTPFMPPEQITNYRNVSPAADQYSAAATLYYLLTKKHVYDFPRDVAKQLLMVLQDEPMRIDKRRPDLAGGIADVIHKALSRVPSERFPDVLAFQQALRAAVG